MAPTAATAIVSASPPLLAKCSGSRLGPRPFSRSSARRCRTSRHGSRSGAIDAQPTVLTRAMRERARTTPGKQVRATTSAASSSAGAEPGRLRSSWPIARITPSGRIDSQCTGTSSSGA